VVLPSSAEVHPGPTTEALPVLRQPTPDVDAKTAVGGQAGLPSSGVQWAGVELGRCLPYSAACRGHRRLLQLGRRVPRVPQVSSQDHQLESAHPHTAGHRSSYAIPGHPVIQVSLTIV